MFHDFIPKKYLCYKRTEIVSRAINIAKNNFLRSDKLEIHCNPSTNIALLLIRDLMISKILFIFIK